MKKPFDNTELSDKRCLTRRRRLKKNLIAKKPNADQCYRCWWPAFRSPGEVDVPPRPPRRSKPRTYVFTPEQDALIRRTYEGGTGQFIGKGPVIRLLALRLGVPKWRVCRRAKEIKAYQPRVKELPWSERELHILELNALLTPIRIRLKLKAQGFTRSENAIKIKCTRRHMKQQMNKGSARAIAACFGVDASTVSDQWIRKGLLKAKRRGTLRTPQQGGDEWLIKEKDIRDFVIQHVGIIDFRKVDKYWLTALLAGCRLE